MKHYIKWSNKKREAKFSFEIEGNTLKLEILEGELQLAKFIRYIIKYTSCPDIKYKRTSPYRIKTGYIERSKRTSYYMYFCKINRLAITSECESIILSVYGSDMCLQGEYSIFIPDLMELLVLKKYVKKDEDGYKIIKKMDSKVYNQYQEYTNSSDTSIFNTNVDSSMQYYGSWTNEENTLESKPKNQLSQDTINKLFTPNARLTKSMLLDKINKALDNNDKDEFLVLSKQYKLLVEEKVY